MNLGKCQLPVQKSWNSCCINYSLDQVKGVSLGRECHKKGLFLFWESSIVFLEVKKDILEAVVWLGWGGQHCKGWIWSNGNILVFRGWVVKIKKKRTKKELGQIYLGIFPQVCTKTRKGKRSSEYPHHTESWCSLRFVGCFCLFFVIIKVLGNMAG